MKLIIGLGNPETRYDNTRHNIGFRLISNYAIKKEVEFKRKDKFRAEIAEIPGHKKVILAKPTTYYNLSGEAALLITEYYKIAPEDVLVIHDELDLPLGTIRTRQGGSDAGNNGIKSVNQRCGDGTGRLRVGITSDEKGAIEDADFVLSKFSDVEHKKLSRIQSKAFVIMDDFIAGNFAPTTHPEV